MPDRSQGRGARRDGPAAGPTRLEFGGHHPEAPLDLKPKLDAIAARAAVLRRHPWRTLAVLLAACVVGALLWATSCGFRGCPSAAAVRAFRPAMGSRILDRNGDLLGRVTNVRRVNVPLARVPKSVRAAFIATEDRRFYHHGGVDWRAAARAAWANLGSLSVREGFSTITMQVVRNAFFPDLASGRSLGRKLIELHMAGRVEAALDKQQILELYLNIIYLGGGTYGVEAASRDLFGRGVEKVTLAQAATLAALAKGPAIYDPRRHPERALARRNLVLSLMAREGFITADQAARASREPLGLSKTRWRPKVEPSYALDPVRAVVDSVLGGRADELGDFTVHTSLDRRAQRAAERAVAQQAAKIGASVQGALVAIDPRTGAIRALVGSRNPEPGGFNRALAARRQPGSAFKPFVYAAALEKGLTPATVLDDSPVTLRDGDGDFWEPANYGGDYGGAMTMRRALMRSANAATVRLWIEVGGGRVVDLARKAGIRARMDPVPSLALGAVEVTPLELATAYAPFANGGYAVRPVLVDSIVGGDGTVLWRNPRHERTRVLDEIVAYQVTSMLRSVVDGGTGYVVRRLGVDGPIAGKTGTTNDGADVWFVGYTPTIVAAVWFGYDRPRPISATASGSRLAAPAWAAFYENGWTESAGGWPEPPGMVTVLIDGTNGMVANEYCPITYREHFREGTQPTRKCTEHHGTIWDVVEDIGKKALEGLKDLLGL